MRKPYKRCYGNTGVAQLFTLFCCSLTTSKLATQSRCWPKSPCLGQMKCDTSSPIAKRKLASATTAH